MYEHPINVTKTFLPPLKEYESYLKTIWDRGYITNQGPLLQKFEENSKEYLGVDNFQFVSNGTVALQLALKGLGIEEGEIITTPFSYVATLSSILWERCTPVFVDIEPETFTIDASQIEKSITSQTKAIMAVHVFGFPCDVDAIDAIAKKHHINVIYDAAHAFGVVYKGRSLLSYGDISTCSFHATKVFHTIEGGCVIANNTEVDKVVDLIKRFGHNGDDHLRLGINAKASETQAAMGLCNFKYVEANILERKNIFRIYDTHLNQKYVKNRIKKDSTHNYSYYPILLDNEADLKRIVTSLNRVNIFPRRYFYPSLNMLPYINDKSECPVSEDIASRILCLPLYVGLGESVVKDICEIINL